MRALVLTPKGPRLQGERPRPAVPGEALLRLKLGGVCATDLELCKGYMGFHGVLGHEFVAVVQDVSDPASDKSIVGRRVVGEINASCGQCATCRAGRPTHCPHRTVLGIAGRDGAFADFFTLPLQNLHVVPDDVPDEAAVFVEPLAAACQILEQVHIHPSDRVVVLGLGRLGQLCARVLALTGAQVTGVARSQAKLDLLPPGVRALRAADVDSLPPADVVVDCTGSPQGLRLAMGCLRPRGTLVLKTTVHAPEALTPTPWVINEITVVGSRCGPFAPALRMLQAGLVDPTPLITARFDLSDGVAALEAAGQPGAIKVLLDPALGR